MISFVFLGPHGVRMLGIDRPLEVEVAAEAFQRRGGRYLMTTFEDGVTQLQAVVEGYAGAVSTIAVEAAVNGPLLPLAVDRLVRASLAGLEARQ